ncbi:MAG: TrpR-related protein YerC/YecD [Lachnospiraceae bacterium]|nr:TrpR-related protein YerC/YecD [Lachnospiraceae bacterium]
MESFHNAYTDKLVDTIAKLKTKKEVYNFLEDLCTIKEILDMSKRLEAAKLLSKGESYNEIISKIGLSSATLSRVNKALNYGTGGYKEVIKKTEA